MTDRRGALLHHFRDFATVTRHMLTSPASFYRAVDWEGHLPAAILYAVEASAFAGLLHVAVSWLLGLLPSPLFASIMWPAVFVAGLLTLLIGALALHGIWYLMGSRRGFEATLHTTAYLGALLPAVVLLNPIPYAGPILSLAWGLWIVVTASVEAQGVPARSSWLVFGVLATVLAIRVTTATAAAAEGPESPESGSICDPPPSVDPL